MVAKIASGEAKPDGVCRVEPDRVRAFLHPLPVGRIWGVGAVARERLRRLGILTIGDLAATPDSQLDRTLGSWGRQVAALARGEDAREIESDRDARSYSEENTFGDDVADPAVLRKTIRAHAEAVARRLRRDHVRARGVTLKLKLARPLGQGRYPLLTRSLMLPVASDDGSVLARAGDQLLDRAGLEEPVRLIGVAAQRIESAGVEQLSFLPTPAEDPRRRRLNRVVDRIHEIFGRDSLERGGREPERAGLTEQIKSGDR
jgi:DNA polymerase-4